MKLIGKSNESMIQKHLKNSKLALPYMELRIIEFAMIEQMASDYLDMVDVSYQGLQEKDAWLILIGALFAMEMAERYREIPEERIADCVPQMFQGLLMLGLPERIFYSLYGQISKLDNSDASESLRNLLMAKGGYSEYEAAIRSLANTINVCLETNNHYGESNINWGQKTEGALYSFYLKAKCNYFCGIAPES